MPAAAEHRAGPADPAGLWRHRDFFWSGHSVSEPGSAVTTLALALTAVVVLHASALQVGLLTTATTVSFLLIAVPAGVVVDRIAKRKLMIACDAARMLIIGSVPSLGATQSFAQVAGPGIGGALFGWLKAGAMTADTLSHAVSTVSLALIRSRETAPPRLG